MAPSKSKRQARTMQAACKNPKFAKKVGIPQNVACEFYEADKKAGIIGKGKKKAAKKRKRKKGGK